MRDFTLKTFRLLLQELKYQGYTFQTFRDFLKVPAPKAIVLRHDVDARKLNSLQTARLEEQLGIVGTYNFRIVPQSFDAEIIRQISAHGHEIGYHYEDLALSKGNMSKAIQLFEQHLEKLRQVVPIDTICMHGSPLSRHDNRKMWEQFDYRNYGIIGEPYFDVDFSKVLYLTDTGRRWDGESVSIRDKVIKDNSRDHFRKGHGDNKILLHSTFDIIESSYNGLLPNQILINIHPQRWNNQIIPWLKELTLQNGKNLIKRFVRG